MYKKIYVVLGVITLISYLFIEYILEFLYGYVYTEADFIVLNMNFQGVRQFFTNFMLVTLILIYFVDKTELGRKVIGGMFVVGSVVLMYTTLSYTVVTDELIVKNRIIPIGKYSWLDVNYIEPEIYRKRIRETRRTGRTKYKLYTKYNIYMENGSRNDVWKDVESVYKIHQYAKSKHIHVKEEDKEINQFKTNYESDFKDDFDKVIEIFYGEEVLEEENI